ncbi:preprotein translocase subunit SecA [Candidatus Gracilibacteria bacterium]|nr:preprotein translocase subunit SecA [Candidatus Gracilibacteria bacterium]
MTLLSRLFGDPTIVILQGYQKDINKVKKIEEEYQKTIDSLDAVQSKTQEFKSRFEPIRLAFITEKDRIDNDATLGLVEKAEMHEKNKKIYIKSREAMVQNIRFEALALHRRASELIYNKEFTLSDGSVKVWNMIPFDVQLVGALTLNGGNIPEMRTGEGKTLVATLAAYLNALSGDPVHVVTVNEYLSRRDASEMSIIYGALGLSTGVVLNSQAREEKKKNYNCDIVYVTNTELGFDYLRDNMAPSMSDQVMSRRAFAIIDEVDSILIDEARTPLIISSPDDEPTSKYLKFAQMANKLSHPEHYTVDEKTKTVALTEEGIERIEKALGIDNIFVSDHYNDLHHIENALRAKACYIRDIDYLVRGDDIMIIDEHTGRVMEGRRFSNGLHQALEAKENVTIQRESKTLANITYQNFFRLYEKLSGMTGTAKTEEEEFQKIYGLSVVQIPTNKPLIRDDRADLLFKNEKGKFQYIVKNIEKIHETGQPILVGTVSVAKSELLSDMLTQKGIKHEVLNAKQDAREAEIVGNAGQKNAITIATNMAGRGTDIKLGEGIAELGGLAILGTEKHETRRIDNQLRGRSGRQGDPGMSQFLVSPSDDIMRIFGGDKLFSMFNSPFFASLPEDEPLIQSKTLTKRITAIQKQVEGRHFDMRKHVLEYDDVMNQHRLIIYSRRQKMLEDFANNDDNGSDIDLQIEKIFRDEAERIVMRHQDEEQKIDTERLSTSLSDILKETVTVTGTEFEEIAEEILSLWKKKLTEVQELFEDRNFDQFQRQIYLAAIDQLWMEHIEKMANLREDVAFEGYNQKQPLLVYQERAYDFFIQMMDEINYRVVRGLLAANANTHVQQAEINLDDLKQVTKSTEPGGHPLFRQQGSQDEEGIKIIRVK